MFLTSVLCLIVALLGPAWAGTFSQVTNYGSNPTGTRMYTYIPSKLASKPPIVVAIHYCTGTAQAYYSGTPYAKLADQYGFVVIYPESPYSGGCWDVSSRAALTHEGGKDTNSIANMVRWALTKYNADAGRVFVTGSSSGAMMTNVMAATYPEMFAAGVAYAGVPAGCFYTGTEAGWNSQCANGQFIQTPAQWAQTVKDMYQGYSGKRPKMQIYHGSADTTLRPQNYNETIKQWSGIFGYSNPTQVLQNTPASPYTKYVYGPNLEGIYGTGVTHAINIFGAEDMKWFGITGESPVTTTTTATSATTTATSTASSAVPTNPGSVGRWEQCGGREYTGPTACVSPYTCTVVNEWYSQCI